MTEGEHRADPPAPPAAFWSTAAIAIVALALGFAASRWGGVGRPVSQADATMTTEVATVEAILLTARGPGTVRQPEDPSGGLSVGVVRSDIASIGEPAPGFTLPTPGGGALALSDLRGRPVVLNFFATWCVPCRVEMPFLQAAHERYGSDKLTILGIDVQEPEDLVSAYLDELGLTFPVVLDESGGQLSAYGIRSLPTTVLIDEAGKVVTIHRGVFTSPRQLDSTLRFVLPEAGG